MGAKMFFKCYVERFFEGALHLCSIVNGTGDGQRIFGVSTQVAIAFFMGREQWGVAG